MSKWHPKCSDIWEKISYRLQTNHRKRLYSSVKYGRPHYKDEIPTMSLNDSVYLFFVGNIKASRWKKQKDIVFIRVATVKWPWAVIQKILKPTKSKKPIVIMIGAML